MSTEAINQNSTQLIKEEQPRCELIQHKSGKLVTRKKKNISTLNRFKDGAAVITITAFLNPFQPDRKHSLFLQP